MKKLKLNLEDLKVESFEISKSRNTLGTIKGQAQGSHTVSVGCDTGEYLSCEYPTCDCDPTMVICTCPPDTQAITCVGNETCDYPWSCVPGEICK
ncbi:MAG: pinensin family lanthipeptide [Ignavibacteria bacterium]|jgi:hypothetical protein